MNTPAETLPDDPAALREIIASLQARHERQTSILLEQIRHLRQLLFGRRSERLPVDSTSVQLPLFDLPEPEHIEPAKVAVESHDRKKPGRKPLPPELPRVEIIHDLPEAEKVCACGCTLSRIGEEVSEQLDIIPARIQVLRHIRPKYACRQCEGVEDEGPTVRIVPMPPQIIPQSIVSPGLLAHVLTAKFVDHLPAVPAGKDLCPARGGDRPGHDEQLGDAGRRGLRAPAQPHPRRDPGGKADQHRRNHDSRSWPNPVGRPPPPPTCGSSAGVIRTGRRSSISIIPPGPAMSPEPSSATIRASSRPTASAATIFSTARPGCVMPAAWAHVRRKFMEVVKAQGKNRTIGSADQALATIQQIYGLEKEARVKRWSPEAISTMRAEKARPILEAFHQWLLKRSSQTPPKGLLGKAISYALNQWERLLVYLEDPIVTPDNNMAENGIRPFVLGRKNWLFSGTPKGAEASAMLYSLIETAKANNCEPYSYLRHIFEHLPRAHTLADYEALLPWNVDRLKIMLRYAEAVD